jgi:hypothetical protein
MQRFIAHFLFVLAAWTLVIKYVFPVAMALAEQLPALTYVLWDFWWVVHLWLGWALLREPAYVYWLALTTSVVEIVIVVTKFAFFFSEPVWDIWRTNWFINKVFVLAVFILLLGHLLGPRRSQPQASRKA